MHDHGGRSVRRRHLSAVIHSLIHGCVIVDHLAVLAYPAPILALDDMEQPTHAAQPP